MLWTLFFTAAAIHATLLVLSFRFRAGVPEWLVRALLVGLIADNLVLAAGQLYFDESWYQSASWVRYLAHVLLLPPLAFAALTILQRAGVAWAQSGVARASVLFFVVAAIATGFVTEIANLELVRETLFGHDRYASAHAAPPVATIATNLVILGMAVVLWRKAGWPWLFVASLTIFVVNGATATMAWGIVAGNLAEIVFVGGWLATLLHFRVN